MPVFGVAGLAEAAMAATLMIGVVGLVLVCVGAVAGYMFRRVEFVIAAILVAIVLGLLLTPWEAFHSVQSDDPDVQNWVAQFRCLAVAWVLVLFASVVVSVIVYRRGPALSAKEQDMGGRPAADAPPQESPPAVRQEEWPP
jgi:TctA family transporter